MARRRSRASTYRPKPFFTGIIHTWQGPIRVADRGDHLILAQGEDWWSEPVIQNTLEQIVGKDKAAEIREAQRRPLTEYRVGRVCVGVKA